MLSLFNVVDVMSSYVKFFNEDSPFVKWLFHTVLIFRNATNALYSELSTLLDVLQWASVCHILSKNSGRPVYSYIYPSFGVGEKIITCYIMSFQVANEINNNAKTLVSFWCRTWLLLNMRLYIPDTTGCIITKYTKSYTVLFKLGMFLRKNIILESH